jgi:maltooligosyltrehalose trehalohydrolase
MQAVLSDPAAPSTFEGSKLDPAERAREGPLYHLYRDLLRMRREDPAFSSQRPGGVEGAAISEEAFVLRFMTNADPWRRQGDRLLVVNLGRDLVLRSIAQPLLAPPERCRWSLTWSSEDPRYGGSGVPEAEVEGGFRVQGHAAAVLAAGPEDRWTERL